MNWQLIQIVLIIIQHIVSVIGIVIILFGVVFGLFQYLFYFFTGQLIEDSGKLNRIRLNLGRTLILGLEFIVAADLIGSTTAPDYYSVGLLAIIVVIRTILNFSINRELISLRQESLT